MCPWCKFCCARLPPPQTPPFSQGGSGANALSKALRPSTHRLSAADARLLEESLRFGVSSLFAADTADGAPVAAEASGGRETGGALDDTTKATRKSAEGSVTPKAEDVPGNQEGQEEDVGEGKDGDGELLLTSCLVS